MENIDMAGGCDLTAASCETAISRSLIYTISDDDDDDQGAQL